MNADALMEMKKNYNQLDFYSVELVRGEVCHTWVWGRRC